jgi:acetyl-CoA C-acetyltransferase
MNEAFVYDAVRTPRGRGKKGGALHAVRPVDLARQVLVAVRERNQLDTRHVEDVILGCVTAIGERGPTSPRPRRCSRNTTRRSAA